MMGSRAVARVTKASILAHALEAQHLAGEHEGIARAQLLDKVFVDLAHDASTGQRLARSGDAAPDEAHLDQRRGDDGAGVHAVGLHEARMRDAQLSGGRGFQLGVAFVVLQCVAAVGNESEHAVEGLAIKRRIRRGGDDLGVERRGIEVAGTRRAENVLRQHVERTLARKGDVLRAGLSRIDGGAAFQNLEAVGGHEDRLRGLIEPVVGAADALDEAAGALRRTHMNDEIDIAPVDAEIERRGGDNRAQRARRHRRFHLAALQGVERAVVQTDRQSEIVDAPQVLKQQLRLHARIDEQQAEAVRLDGRVNLADGVARRMPDRRHRSR